MLIDIVILPSNKIRNSIGSRIKEKAGKLPNYFLVDNKKLIPHLSLWHLKTSKNRIEPIRKTLQKLIKNQKPIKISAFNLQAIPKYKGCVDFPVGNTKPLENLREKVVQNTYLYKTGIMPQFASQIGMKLPKGEKLKEIKKYGRSYGFHPHFTMGWLKRRKDALKTVEAMKGYNFSFYAKEIYICEVDRWWQVTRIIKKIPFR